MSRSILQNRSSPLKCVSSEGCFDFLQCFESTGEERKACMKDGNSNYVDVEGESNHFTDTKLWPLMVRTISFLFITSRYVLNSFHLVLDLFFGILF